VPRENGEALIGEFSVKHCRCADVAVLMQLAPNRDHLLGWWQNMLAGWSRALGLVAVAALLANAQCYDTCAVAACKASQTPSSDCPLHHHKSSHEDSSGCLHHHSEFISPESAIAKVNLAPVVPIVAVLTASSEMVLIEPFLLSTPDTGSPPGGQASPAISVLRI
jgi:hypothetical protein